MSTNDNEYNFFIVYGTFILIFFFFCQNSTGTSGISHIFVRHQQDDDDDVTITSRPHPGLPVITVEQQHPSLHDSSFRLCTIHDSIIEEEDERGRSAVGVKDTSHVKSSADTGEVDLQCNNTMETVASREKVPMEMTYEAIHHKSKSPGQDEEGITLEGHHGEQNEVLTEGENEIKEAEQKPEEFQPPAVAPPHPLSAEGEESGMPYCL